MDLRMTAFLILSGPGRFWIWLCGLIFGIEVIAEPEVVDE